MYWVLSFELHEAIFRRLAFLPKTSFHFIFTWEVVTNAVSMFDFRFLSHSKSAFSCTSLTIDLDFAWRAFCFCFPTHQTEILRKSSEGYRASLIYWISRIASKYASTLVFFDINGGFFFQVFHVFSLLLCKFHVWFFVALSSRDG